MRHDAENQVTAAGVIGPLSLDDALYMAKRANRIGPLQVVPAHRVLGWDHVRSAAMHAQRSMAEGRHQADRLEVEFTRYLAGKRQIKAALAHVGLQPQNDAAIVIGLGDHHADAVHYFVDALGLREDDRLMDWSAEKHSAWGFEESQPEAQILQDVAAVDLMRS